MPPPCNGPPGILPGGVTCPEYIRHTTTFVHATEDLLDAAKRRDLEATPLAYVSLTLSCVQCHRYAARMRIARESVVSPFEGRASDLRREMMLRRLSQPLAWILIVSPRHFGSGSARLPRLVRA